MALTKALIIDQDAARQIPVMFNPPEYQLQRTNQFAEIGLPGLESSIIQFVRGAAQTLTMELFFDSTKDGTDVRDHTDEVVGLTRVNSETHAPPRLLFLWGSLAFPCILESVTQRFVQFDSAGIPLRAELTVTLKGFEVLAGILARMALQSADRTKQVTVRAGDTLQGIAGKEYGDPGLWRPIAKANDIDNPLTVRPGTSLRIPALEGGT
jgi:hypothetical protein